ncbi:hypothetical protein [Persicobacter sp. CCB-QB2]|uniref:hypothetical protein n=1 Tax=Persicobacter sp. CCB-QB2 TaxID=1561025 RepID=UPI0012F980E6|nr:hypothetical protein [Persicobacter sp. CCB-QB2]
MLILSLMVLAACIPPREDMAEEGGLQLSFDLFEDNSRLKNLSLSEVEAVIFEFSKFENNDLFGNEKLVGLSAYFQNGRVLSNKLLLAKGDYTISRAFLLNDEAAFDFNAAKVLDPNAVVGIVPISEGVLPLSFSISGNDIYSKELPFMNAKGINLEDVGYGDFTGQDNSSDFRLVITEFKLSTFNNSSGFDLNIAAAHFNIDYVVAGQQFNVIDKSFEWGMANFYVPNDAEFLNVSLDFSACVDCQSTFEYFNYLRNRGEGYGEQIGSGLPSGNTISFRFDLSTAGAEEDLWFLSILNSCPACELDECSLMRLNQVSDEYETGDQVTTQADSYHFTLCDGRSFYWLWEKNTHFTDTPPSVRFNSQTETDDQLWGQRGRSIYYCLAETSDWEFKGICVGDLSKVNWSLDIEEWPYRYQTEPSLWVTYVYDFGDYQKGEIVHYNGFVYIATQDIPNEGSAGDSSNNRPDRHSGWKQLTTYTTNISC